jgi:NAD(P)H-quinone oxidoreductase subunit 5
MMTYAISMALLVMSIGTIIWSNITQDMTLMGGLWSRRPISGLAFLVGAAGMIGFPPLGGFWALLQLMPHFWESQPLVVGVVLSVNVLTAVSLTRIFGRVFTGKAHPLMTRSPEVLWPMVLPMTVLSGVVLHFPLLMNQWGLLPSISEINRVFALLLIGSSILGMAIGGGLYLGPWTQKPVRLAWPALQDFFANDLYTAETYRRTIILAVTQISRLIDIFDRRIIDGVVNGIGLTTLWGGQTLKYNNTGFGQFYLLSILIAMSLIALLITSPLLF